MATQALYQVPDIKPDIGMKAFLNDYLATHTATDPLFRRAIITLVEHRFDYEGIDYADQLLDDIKAKGGHHPDVRAVQTISDEELSFKWARLLMSLTLDAGILPTIMRYIGMIAAERFNVQLNGNFETAVQNFLTQVGHTPVVATNASAQREISVVPLGNGAEAHDTDADGIDGEDENLDDVENRRIYDHAEPETVKSTPKRTGCYRYSRCLCVPGVENRLAPTLTRKQRVSLLRSQTPILDLFFPKRRIGTAGAQLSTIIDGLRSRANSVPSHVNNISLSARLNGPGQNPWYKELDRAFNSYKWIKPRKVEAILQQFVDVNQCLFPELRTTDLKDAGDKIKKEKA